MKPPLLQTVNLTRAFGTTKAVDELTLTCPPGMITILLGKNGAGKTTLMRLWAGLLAPTSGEVRVLGFDPRAPDGDSRRHIGWIGDGHTPPPECTVAQCLDLQAQADPQFDRTRAANILEAGKVDHRSAVHALSKGRNRSLLAALALGRPCPILLLDEPAEGLDVEARRHFYRAVRDHVNEHASTAVISTHILHDTEPVADTIAIIHQGRLLLRDDLEEMRDQIRILPPADFPPPDLPPDTKTVATSTDGTRILRRQAPWPQPDIPPIRPFNLEQLFLTLTGSSS